MKYDIWDLLQNNLGREGMSEGIGRIKLGRG
jgi:hypothetical protein